MSKLHDYDLFEPMICPTELGFSVEMDPSGMGERVRIPFRKTVYSAISLTAQCSLVAADGLVIKEGDMFDDYHGFGSCLFHAIEAGEKYQASLGSSNLNPIVEVTTLTRPVVMVSREPFYLGAVRGSFVPGWWRADEPARLPQGESQKWTPWKSGEKTEDFDLLMIFIHQAIDADKAARYRNGDLHVAKTLRTAVAQPAEEPELA